LAADEAGRRLFVDSAALVPVPTHQPSHQTRTTFFFSSAMLPSSPQTQLNLFATAEKSSVCSCCNHMHATPTPLGPRRRRSPPLDGGATAASAAKSPKLRVYFLEKRVFLAFLL